MSGITAFLCAFLASKEFEGGNRHAGWALAILAAASLINAVIDTLLILDKWMT